jgi:hypothetical protein
MNEAKIGLRENRNVFQPGEELHGAAAWKCEVAPRAVEIRLFWFTRGRGTEDVGLADTMRFEHPQAEQALPFQFKLPPAPYSFSGKLVTLVWAAEAVLEPSKASARVEFVMAPGNKEIVLGVA